MALKYKRTDVINLLKQCVGNHASPSRKPIGSDEETCCICLDKPPTHMLIGSGETCGHGQYCEGCATNPSMKKCAICRVEFTHVHRWKEELP